MNIDKLIFLSIIITLLACGRIIAQDKSLEAEQTIFVFGGEINKNRKFVEYVAELTKKEHPKICLLPTASGDSEDYIKIWGGICESLGLEKHILKVWVNSQNTTETFEETLLGMDAIVVSGGNTLNMLAIWKAQGIDKALKKALDRGIVLAGGSAGAICWFQNGISDSRPVNLSIVEGLSFLPYSHCSHYGDSLKRSMYHQEILSKNMNEGYACDDLSGILFKNGKYVKSLSLDDVNHSYHVTLQEGRIKSERLPSDIYVSGNALPEKAYSSLEVNKKVGEFEGKLGQKTPLDAYITFQNEIMDDVNTSPERKSKIREIPISKVLVYDNRFAGVINLGYSDFVAIWYFYNDQGKWISIGEDIGGQTILATEVTFREKAKIVLESTLKKSNEL